MLDFLLVLILFFLAVYSSTLAWAPLPAVTAAGAIAPAGAASVWLPVAPAGVYGWGYRADRVYVVDGSNGAEAISRRRIGSAIGP
jgi:hypothetical protein